MNLENCGSFPNLLFFYVFKGIYEALELRDGGSDYLGKGVSKVMIDFFLVDIERIDIYLI